MLSRANRLNKQKDFDAIFRRGGVIQDDFLVVRFLANQQKVSRFGLAVSVKAAGKAVSRNKVRRQLNEAIRLNLNKIRTGFDFIIVVKAKLVGADYQKIEASFLNLLERKGLYDA